MADLPATEAVASPAWRVGIAALLAGVAFAFHTALGDMASIWANQADYSHGFLVPFIAAYILYARRSRIPVTFTWPDPLGLVPLVLGVALSVAAGVTNFGKEFSQGVGFVLALTGVLILCVGRLGLRWAWPGLLYLLFMVKLPDRLEIQFMFKLRQVATGGSNFLLQALGYPAYMTGPQGTIITVGELKLGVDWACSGLSMVLTFVALATAFAILLRERPLGDRLAILLSSLPIAIASNILRITVTALVYLAGWKWLGDKIVHDLAGYLMMPLALGFIWAELRLIDWLFVVPQKTDRDTVLKSGRQVQTADWKVDKPPAPPEAGR